MIAVDVKLSVRKLHNLTDAEYKACERLNFGWEGDMQTKVREFWAEPGDHSKVYRILDEGTLLSWALVFPERKLYDKYGVWSPYYSTEEYSAYFYTRATHRRQGHGKRIIKRVLRDFPGVYVYPEWGMDYQEDCNVHFFNKFVPVDQHR